MEGTARAVVRTLDELEARRPVIVGYSMGGRLALYLALRYPERCTGLFLESASPGLESAGEREARRDADEEKAKRLESGDFENFLRDWYRQPLFAPLAREERLLWRTIEARRRNDPSELARSLRGMGTGSAGRPRRTRARSHRRIGREVRRDLFPHGEYLREGRVRGGPWRGTQRARRGARAVRCPSRALSGPAISCVR